MKFTTSILYILIGSVLSDVHYYPEERLNRGYQKARTVTLTKYQPQKTITVAGAAASTLTITQLQYVTKCDTKSTSYPSQQPIEEPKPIEKPSPTGSNPPSTNDRSIEMLCRVNQIRSKVGKKPLKIDQRLMQSAQKHSEDQAASRNMSHTGTKIRSFFDRIKAEGYSAFSAGENVAYNQRSVEQAMNSWIKSSGHYQNLIGNYECFGWGEKDFYWTQNMATGQACTDSVLPHCNKYY